MVEVQLIYDPNSPGIDFVPESPIVVYLRHLFSLEHLEKDFSLIMSMDADLWVPLSFISNLEGIKTLCNDRYELFSACYKAGLQISGEYVRNKVEIPRKNVYIRDIDNIEERIKGLEFESLETEANGYILCCSSEEFAVDNVVELRKRKVNCEIDYINPYVYLLDKVLAFVRNGSFLAINQFFCVPKSTPTTYSIEHLKEIYSKSKLSLPDALKKFRKTGMVRKTPAKINILINSN